MDRKEKKEKKEQPVKPVNVHITNHNKFEKGVGAFITNLNHLTIVMDSEGNMKLNADQVPAPVMPQTEVEKDAPQDDDGDEGNDVSTNINDLVTKLKPIFFNNEEDVRLFLKEIVGMREKDITDLVNKWVNDKRISDFGNSRKGVLWTILNDAGLYNKSKQNWNRRVF